MFQPDPWSGWEQLLEMLFSESEPETTAHRNAEFSVVGIKIPNREKDRSEANQLGDRGEHTGGTSSSISASSTYLEGFFLSACSVHTLCDLHLLGTSATFPKELNPASCLQPRFFAWAPDPPGQLCLGVLQTFTFSLHPPTSPHLTSQLGRLLTFSILENDIITHWKYGNHSEILPMHTHLPHY